MEHMEWSFFILVARYTILTVHLPGKPWGRASDGSWLENVYFGSRQVRVPLGGSSVDWD